MSSRTLAPFFTEAARARRDARDPWSLRNLPPADARVWAQVGDR